MKVVFTILKCKNLESLEPYLSILKRNIKNRKIVKSNLKPFREIGHFNTNTVWFKNRFNIL